MVAARFDDSKLRYTVKMIKTVDLLLPLQVLRFISCPADPDPSPHSSRGLFTDALVIFTRFFTNGPDKNRTIA